jgi:hypothetical protein
MGLSLFALSFDGSKTFQLSVTRLTFTGCLLDSSLATGLLNCSVIVQGRAVAPGRAYRAVAIVIEWTIVTLVVLLSMESIQDELLPKLVLLVPSDTCLCTSSLLCSLLGKVRVEVTVVWVVGIRVESRDWSYDEHCDWDDESCSLS